jgi:tetratricopeptide (TPR) repeat protein
MDEIKPSKIVCKECGYESNVISDVCIKCGGKLIKICGNCESENSVEKMYCDSCGLLLALTPHKKLDLGKKENSIYISKSISTLEFEPITETMSKRDESYRKKKNEGKKDDNKSLSIVEKNKIEEYVKSQEISIENLKTQRTLPAKDDKRYIPYIIFICVVIVVFLSYFLIVRKGISRYTLVSTAKNYLEALRDGDYEKAYSYLSNNSKSLVSIDDYKNTSRNYYSKIGKWDFKDVEIYYYSPTQSIIHYKLLENGEWKDDYLNFVKEYGHWRRPYVWNLFEKIDDAFSQKDFPKALYFSQMLYLIDPIDPRSSGYLCWSEYFMRLFDKSVESCKKVIELSNLYPVKYYDNQELFWYRFNYADSLRFLGRDDEALNNFNILIDYDMPLASKCSIFTARSDIFVNRKNYDMAIGDLNRALTVCKNEVVLKDVNKYLSILKGNECEMALNFLKSHKYNDLKFEDFINSKIKSYKKSGIKVEYNCNHKDGADYEILVLIKQRDKVFDRYKAVLNLWYRKIDILEGM